MTKSQVKLLTIFKNDIERIKAHNKRVGSRTGQCSLFESSDSNFGWFVWAESSDSTAHSKH